MCVIDSFPIVEGFVRRINDLQSSESRSCQRVMKEDLPGVPAHRGTLAGGHLKRLERRKALEDLTDAKPGNHQQCQQQHGATGK